MPLGSSYGLPRIMIPTPVVRALRGILILESGGFILAAGAGFCEVLSVP